MYLNIRVYKGIQLFCKTMKYSELLFFAYRYRRSCAAKCGKLEQLLGSVWGRSQPTAAITAQMHCVKQRAVTEAAAGVEKPLQ